MKPVPFFLAFLSISLITFTMPSMALADPDLEETTPPVAKTPLPDGPITSWIGHGIPEFFKSMTKMEYWKQGGLFAAGTMIGLRIMRFPILAPFVGLFAADLYGKRLQPDRFPQRLISSIMVGATMLGMLVVGGKMLGLPPGILSFAILGKGGLVFGLALFAAMAIAIGPLSMFLINKLEPYAAKWIKGIGTGLLEKSPIQPTSQSSSPSPGLFQSLQGLPGLSGN